MLRSESWPSWVVGVVFGAAAGLMGMIGGAPFLFLSVAFLALAFVAARSLAFLSGAFTGLGATWIVVITLTANATQAMMAVIGVSGVVVVVGTLIGVIAWRRRSDQLRSQSGS